VYHREYLEALCLLSRAFDLAEKRGAPRPIVVGGSAVEFYTGGEITSGDFDLVAVDEDIIGEALLDVGFRREDRRGVQLGGFYHPDLLIGVEFVTGPLFDGRTDMNRLRLVVVDEEQNARIILPPPEDVIADRLAQYASDPKGRDDMLEQARLLVLLAEDLDLNYLRRRAVEEGADAQLVERLTTK
jgi:hypothetical protein